MKAPKTIKDFKLYTKKPNTLAKGYYYQTSLYFDVPNKFKNRMVRVYLPSNYQFDNPNQRFPVIYMTDGQNLCDQYLSGYGEWHADECLEDRISKGKQGFIIVGIDCPYDEEDRLIEMSVSSLKEAIHNLRESKSGIGYADKLSDFILNNVKNLIDSTFFTLTDKKNTAVGGSSMGGLMAFYMGNAYKNIVGCSLVFSPGFLIYKRNYFEKAMKAHYFNKDELGKFIFYVGGVDFEQKFVHSTFYAYNLLKRQGFGIDQLRLIYDSNMIHHEDPWSKYFPTAISFWLDD